jgi:hypothetical protein
MGTILQRSLFMLVLAASVLGQIPNPTVLQSAVDRGLQRSDLQAFLVAAREEPTSPEMYSAVLAAGKTGDSFWVPHLKPFLKFARNRNIDLTRLADTTQLALARLGEPAQLQEIACEAEFGNAEIQYLAVRSKMKYVDGWFSIYIMARWLNEDYKPRYLLKSPPSDMVYNPPSQLALIALPELVSNPPLQAPSPLWLATDNQEKLRPLRKGWREWIEVNRATLSALRPGIDDLDLSETTCKRVLAKDRHIDAPH